MLQSVIIKIRYFGIFVLIVLMTLSSHPTIVEMSRADGIESGTILSRYIIIVFGLLFVMSFDLKQIIQSRLICRICIMLLTVLLVWLLSNVFFHTNEVYSDVKSFVICIVAILIGWLNYMNLKWIKFILLSFSFMTVFVGLMQVLRNVGGFVILDQYVTDNKNALGVMLATSSLIFVLLSTDLGKFNKERVLFLAMAVFSFAIMMTIRSRAAMLSLVIILMFVFYERYKGKHLVMYFILASFLIMLLIICLPSEIKEYAWNSMFQGRENDLTSGRAERNEVAIDIFLEYPLFGNLSAQRRVDWVHNYPLLKLQDYGLLFGLPVLSIYFCILIFIIRTLAKKNSVAIYNIGYYALLIPFIDSMAEPSFPFGPGTATVFNFIVFGTAIRHDYQCELESCNGVNDSVFFEKTATW